MSDSRFDSEVPRRSARIGRKRAGVLRVIWFSRHVPLTSQVAELEQLFAPCEIVQDERTFASADEMLSRFASCEGDEMVVVAPLSVIDQLCKRGARPLWAEMEDVTDANGGEVRARGRAYRFLRFRRILGITIHYADVVGRQAV